MNKSGNGQRDKSARWGFRCSSLLQLHKLLHPILFVEMLHFYSYLVFIFKMSRQLLSCINASMLAAGTSKIYSQITKSSFNIIFYRYVYNVKHAIQKLVHLRLLFKKIYYCFV